MRVTLVVDDEAMVEALAEVLRRATPAFRATNSPGARTEGGEQLLRIPEVASRLGVSRGKVYQLCTSGDIASVRVGQAVRVRASALDEYLRTAEAAEVEIGPHGRPRARRGR